MDIRIVPASGLEKIFLDEAPAGTYHGGSLLRNEGYSFQFAFLGLPGLAPTWKFAQVSIESDLKDNLDLYAVAQVPATFAAPLCNDSGYLRTAPGLYPDPLVPLKDGTVKVMADRWQSIWVRTKGLLPAGCHKVQITLTAEGLEPATASVELNVVDALLPPQKLIYTNWFHVDCIADIHQCEMFSEAHWEKIGQYMALAGQNGMNMILTPCFTPPLDTPEGGERATAQLVGVHKHGDAYAFDFTLLDRFIRLAQENGITHFEHSHFFTQWGAYHAPKVVADGERIFGWDTQADGPEYTAFLHQYLDALLPHLKALGVDKNFFFHISDEPVAEHLASYRRAKAIVADRLAGYPMFDAMSHFELYEQGAVDIPAASTQTVSDFVGKCDNLWAYYTGFCSFALSNRLISMSSRRNRVLGMQLYKNHIRGFLHWGFNFYYTTLSRELFDPWTSPDAMAEFCAGTSYQVYPTAEGPVPSLRLFVFMDAMQDIRAMELLEEKLGHDAVVELLEKHGGTIDWDACPMTDEQFLQIREALNRAIAE